MSSGSGGNFDSSRLLLFFQGFSYGPWLWASVWLCSEGPFFNIVDYTWYVWVQIRGPY